MKFALNMILAATFVSSAAMAAAPQDVTNATVRFNTNVARPVPAFTLVPVVSVGSSSFSQFDVRSTSTNTTATNNDLSSATSYEAGVLAEIGRGAFVFQTGLLFMNEGFKLTERSLSTSGVITSVDETGSFQYIGIPLALKGRVRVSEGIRLSGRVGVIPALVASAKDDFTETETDQFGNVINRNSGSSTMSTSNTAVRAAQVFAVAGGGPEFRIARKQNVRLEANYERMLVNMVTSDSSVMMQSINAMVSYGISF